MMRPGRLTKRTSYGKSPIVILDHRDPNIQAPGIDLKPTAPKQSPSVTLQDSPLAAETRPRNINYNKNSANSIVANKVKQRELNKTNNQEMTQYAMEIAIDTAGYQLVNYFTGEKVDVKDLGMFAASDFLNIYMFRDFIIRKVAPALKITDQSTEGERLLIEIIADLIGTMGPYLLMAKFFEHEKSKKELALAIVGSTLINKTYNYFVADMGLKR